MYQPATAVEDGTASAPLPVRPRVISWVLTPISGMVSETGRETGRGSAGCRGATIGPVGAGRAATAAAGRTGWAGWRVSSRPAVPPAMTIRPAASESIAAGLRIGMG